MRVFVGSALFVSMLLSVAPAPGAQTRELVIVNQTGATLYFLYASPSDSETWGDDLLGAAVLGNGETHRIRLRAAAEAAGLYDVRAIDSNDNEYIVWSWDLVRENRVVIRSANFVGLHSRAVAGGAAEGAVLAWLDIVNETGYRVVQVFVAPADDGGREDGQQLLAPQQTIYSGETYRVEVDVEGFGTYVFDVVLVDEEGDRYVKWDINLETVAEVTYTLEDLEL